MAQAPFIFQTERLRLDPLRFDDWPIVLREWGVPEIARMTATFRSDWTEEEVQDWVRARLEPDENGIGCAMRRLSDGRLIGSVGMGGDPKNLGYAIAKPFWGQGYATEAVRGFLTAAYAHYGDIDVVEASVFDDNPASARVLQKLGFVNAGCSDCSSLARVEPAPSSLYRLYRAKLKA